MTYLTGNTGPIDYEALRQIRNIFLKNEPLVTHHDLSERLDPQPELNITVGEGFGSIRSIRYHLD